MYSISQFTFRQKFILNTILKKDSLNVSGLSHELDIGSRTILREISAINKILNSDGINIDDNNLKLSIKGTKKNIDYLRQSLKHIPAQWLMSQEQRILMITAQLLLADEPYKSAFFSYQLNVTEGTISLYMDKIDEWLKARYLTLVRKRGHGIAVNGSEWLKRNSIVELIYSLKSVDELCAYMYESKDDITIHTFFKILFGDELVSAAKKLMKLFEEYIKMDDMAYFSSLIYVLISLKKMKSGFQIELPADLTHDVLSSKTFDFINNIKKYLLSLNIVPKDSELTYIAIHTSGGKYIYKGNREFEELGVSFEDISKELVYEVERKMHITIKCDEQLILGLSQHFSSALYKINMDIPVRNTILNQIKEHYNNLFKAVSYVCRLIFSKYNISMSQDEIGFITMHIGAAIERTNSSKDRFSMLIICPNGIGTAKILSNKIKSAIHNIASITIKSFKDWAEGDEDYDIVLSTVNIAPEEKVKNDNIIVVSPFLEKNDIDRINNYIAEISSKNNVLNKSICLRDSSEEKKFPKEKITQEEKHEMADKLINSIRINIIGTQSFKELIKLISQDVYTYNIVSDSEEIENLILTREKLGNVVIPNSHMALLHTRSDCVIKPFAGVYRLKDCMRLRSIGFDYENVDTFIVLLARKKEHPYILEQMGKISMSLIENKDLCKILRNENIENLHIEMMKVLDREDM